MSGSGQVGIMLFINNIKSCLCHISFGEWSDKTFNTIVEIISISLFLQILRMNSNYLHVSLNQVYLSGICFN